MAYTSGNLILDDHYNDFVNNGATAINTVWGQGTGDKGYGQSNTLGTVSPAQLVTATQWSNFLARMASAAAHQGSSITSQSLPTTGNDIEIFANISTDLTTITTNRLNHGGVYSTTNDLNGINGSGAGTWSTQTKHSFSLTFDGGDEIRYFFNAGGQIVITPTITPGGTPNAKENEWNDLLETLIGSVTFSGGATTRSGTGTISSSIQGYHNLTPNVNQNIFKMFADTGPYTANYFQININPGVAHSDGRGNVGNVLTFEIICRDDAAEDDEDLGTPGSQITLDQIDGTIAFSIDVKEPSVANLNSATWGTIAGVDLGITQS